MDENGTYQVELVGRELGGLIGRRGETLDAIQQLTGQTYVDVYASRVKRGDLRDADTSRFVLDHPNHNQPVPPRTADLGARTQPTPEA